MFVAADCMDMLLLVLMLMQKHEVACCRGRDIVKHLL